MSEQLNQHLSSKRLGDSLPNRQLMIEERREEAKKSGGPTQRIGNFQGKSIDLQIFRVPIGMPKYRMSNGRTASAQQELVTRKQLDENFFDQDPELFELQEAQHSILKEMVGEQGLLDTFKDATKPESRQSEALILDCDGFVVNGNRRLCCWRSLHEEKPDVYQHFSHVEVVVLPQSEQKEIDELEAQLQIAPDIKSDYSWHSRATMLKKKLAQYNYTTSQLAKLYGFKKKKDLDELLEALELGGEYLETRGVKNVWSQLPESEHTFIRLAEAINRKKSITDKEILKSLTFNVIDNPSVAGERLYAFIPKIGTHLDAIKSNLESQLPHLAETAGGSDGSSVFGSGGQTTSNSARYSEIKDTPANLKIAQLVVRDTIESEKSKANEQETANALLKFLIQSQTALHNAVNLGLLPEANTEGVENQITAIEDSLEKIKLFIKDKGN